MNNPHELSFVKRKILIGGFINLNAVDGSAFFLSSVAAMCAQYSQVEVVLASAVPLTNNVVIDELLDYPNVTLVDPFDSELLENRFQLQRDKRLSRQEYADFVSLLCDKIEFSAVLIRDTEVGRLFLERRPELDLITSVYLTGLTSVVQSPAATDIENYKRIVKTSAGIVLQTEVMKKTFLEIFPFVNQKRIFILPPHVPDSAGTFEDVFHYPERPSRLIYSGKFFPAWNTDKILAGFKAVASGSEVPLTLSVAGDYFKNDPDDPNFVRNCRYLLSSTQGITWHGSVPRNVSRLLIKDADIGISWRRPSLGSSSEFSTKVLEYGAVGRPVILNKTSAHVELLGEDYPFYADSMSQYKEIIRTLPSSGEKLEFAALRCYELAKEHWYSNVRKGLVDFLFIDSKEGGELRGNIDSDFSIDCTASFKYDACGQGIVDGPRFHFFEDDNQQRTVGELLRAAQYQQQIWEASIRNTADLRSCQRTPKASTSTESESLEKLKAENKELRERIRLVESRINRLKTFVKKVETRRFGGFIVKRARRFTKHAVRMLDNL